MDNEEFERTMKARGLMNQVEAAYQWAKWAQEIPCLQFPSDWQVQIIPPFAGAIIRFCVTREGLDENVSVYLDCYDQLGHYGQPYWEIFPHAPNGTFRCAMKNTDTLLKAIGESLDELAELM